MFKLRSVLFWSAVAVSPLPFGIGSVSWDGGEGVRWLWTDFPEGSLLSAAVAVSLWMAYVRVSHRLRLVGSESARR